MEVRYDLLSSVLVCLGKSEDSENRLIDMLTTLLSTELPATEKLEKLENKFSIKTHEIAREVNSMCNLSELVEEKGIEKGRAEGRVLGINVLVDTMKELNQPIDSIVQKLIEKFNLSEAEAKTYV